MDSKPSKPHHPSYRLHRRQAAWQIILPIVLAGLVLLVATYFIVVGTFRGNGDVNRWAAISTIWLTIPVLVAGLVALVLLIAVAWAVGKGAGFIPPYSYKAQLFVSEVEARVKQGAVYAHRPMRIIPQIWQLIRNGFRRMRGR